MKRKVLSCCFLLLSFSISAQVIRLSANAKPLNQILIEMRDAYGIRFSFDDNELSRFKVTVHDEFQTPQKALDYLLKPLSYTFLQNQGVFVIYRVPATISTPPYHSLEVRPKREYLLSGTVYDQQNGETLPYAFIEINKTTIACDDKGRFTFSSKNDSLFSLTIRHLGYFIKDTVVGFGINRKFNLQTANFAIKEVVVSSQIEKSMQTYEMPGSLRANNQIAKDIPGNEGGSVFSLLRLLPGVFSAGEQSRDLVIWGGYEGQSEVTFDGFTLFGLKNFNDNISVVNPYLVKDIKVFKGGFGSRYDDKVGGIVNVTGVDGNLHKPEVKTNISNLTLNAYGSSPLGKKASVVAAYRQTFYNLYEEQTTTQLLPQGRNNNLSLAEFYVTPNYRFRDGNVKLSGKTSSDDSYLVSLYGAKDRFSYNVSNQSVLNPASTQALQQHTQLGASAQYSKQWLSGVRSSFLLTFSRLNTTTDNVSSDSRGFVNRSLNEVNNINELKLNFENEIVSSEKHAIKLGGGLAAYRTDYSQLSTPTSAPFNLFPTANGARIWNAYFTDRIAVLPQLSVSPGIRLNFAGFNRGFYWQPRLSANWEVSKHFSIAGSYGKYHQFNSKVLYLEQYTARPNTGHENHDQPLPPDQSEQIWTVADGYKVPVATSMHQVLGLYYQNQGFSASSEAFLKTTTGLSRWKRTYNVSQYNRDSIIFGEGKAFGIDLMVKQQYKKHYAWISYSYGKTKEHFNNQTEYQYAPQDQRHELKAAALFDFSPVSFSSSYVYGSGYPNYKGLSLLQNSARQSYHRLDASLTYRFPTRKYKMQAGVTVLNILDTKNLIFSNLVSSSTSSSDMFAVYSQAIPLTPMIFFEFSY